MSSAISALGRWRWRGYSIETPRLVYEIFGVDREQVAGDSALLRELVHADDRVSYETMLLGVQTTGIPDSAAFRIRRPDGEQRILQSQARLVERDGHAKLVGTVMDITETAIIATDPEGLITVFNRGAERMLGEAPMRWSAATRRRFSTTRLRSPRGRSSLGSSRALRCSRTVRAPGARRPANGHTCTPTAIGWRCP